MLISSSSWTEPNFVYLIWHLHKHKYQTPEVKEVQISNKYFWSYFLEMKEQISHWIGVCSYNWNLQIAILSLQWQLVKMKWVDNPLNWSLKFLLKSANNTINSLLPSNITKYLSMVSLHNLPKSVRNPYHQNLKIVKACQLLTYLIQPCVIKLGFVRNIGVKTWFLTVGRFFSNYGK